MRFQDFTIDFKISRKISRFQDFTKDFKISRKISLEVYEISASGGPLVVIYDYDGSIGVHHFLHHISQEEHCKPQHIILGQYFFCKSSGILFFSFNN